MCARRLAPRFRRGRRRHLSEPGHAFSVTLPDDWQRLDPAVFARFKAAALAKGRGVEAVEACFQVRENGVDQPAALILLYHDYPNESLAELAATDEKEMTAMADAVKIAYRLGTPPKDGITDGTVEECRWMNPQMEVS